MENDISTLYILELDILSAVKSAKISTILCPFVHMTPCSKVSVRSVLKYFGILYVETMFGNKGWSCCRHVFLVVNMHKESMLKQIHVHFHARNKCEINSLTSLDVFNKC